MAVMQALLKIKADVTGEGEVDKLGRALGSVGRTAGAVTGSLKGLTAAAGMGGLAGSMGALLPLLSVGGLVGMAKSALDAGDKFNDLAQKTGVSVEALARFKKAAATSGTDIDTVAKAIGKLSNGMYDAAKTGKGPAKEALDELGISAVDASGKLRSADDVMLDIASKFKDLPDGVRKSALAVDLFGKSGRELIPMLNMGGDAIDKMKVKMTSAFAEKADEYTDKLTALSGKVGALGMDIMVALLPALDSLASGLTKIVDAFNAVDPSIRNIIILAAGLAIAWGPLVGIFTTLSGVITALAGLQLGATIAGWLGAVGPFIVGFQAALTGLLAWISGTFLPALIAFFSGPVGWTVLAVAAVVAMVILFREPIMQFLGWIAEAFKWGLQAVYAIAWQLLVQPWINLYNLTLREPVTQMWNWFKEVWTGAVKFWNEKVVAPIKGAWDGLMSGIQSVMQRVANVVSGIWNGIVNSIRGVINGFLGGISYAINGTINSVNSLIAAFNRLPGPDIGLIPNVSVPQFAEGGVVDRPTLGVIGEGGEREYIIPESKMRAAASAYLGGARGSSVLSPSTINVQTGPVLQQGGQTYVTVADLQRAMRATEAGTLARIRTPAGRTALGIR